MNQRRYIEGQNKVTEIKIDDIKRRIENEVNILNSQTERVVDDVLVEETNSPYEERNQHQAELLQNQAEIEELSLRN